jgi:hypothetical protein
MKTPKKGVEGWIPWVDELTPKLPVQLSPCSLTRTLKFPDARKTSRFLQHNIAPQRV